MHGRCPMTHLCIGGAQGELLARIQARRPASAWELYMLELQHLLDPRPNPTKALLPPRGPQWKALEDFAANIYSLSHTLHLAAAHDHPHTYFEILLDKADRYPPPASVFQWERQS